MVCLCQSFTQLNQYTVREEIGQVSQPHLVVAVRLPLTGFVLQGSYGVVRVATDKRNSTQHVGTVTDCLCLPVSDLCVISIRL